MRVIGVIDLLAGSAVHARAGNRASYAPVREVAGLTIEPGNALQLAHAYIDQLGLRELYVADLDAILGRTPQQTMIRTLSALAAALWVDAGISSLQSARSAFDAGATHAIVGLETLSDFASLTDICSMLGGDRVAFSLDLRHGTPTGPAAADLPPHDLAARAAAAGAGTVIVLDLARVGSGAGLDFEGIAGIRQAAPDVTLLAGGGVRGSDDLARIAECGCDGALVATALHDGRLRLADLHSAARLTPYRSVRR